MIVDVHETAIHPLLQKGGYGHTIEHLKVGDVIEGDICIERKTIEDLVSSLRSKRLWTQLLQMEDNYVHNYLIIVGDLKDAFFNPHLRNWTNEHHLGLLASLNVRFSKLKCIQVSNNTQYVRLVHKLIEKSKDSGQMGQMQTSVMTISDKLTIDDVKLRMLASIPRIGYNRAQILRNKVDVKLVNKEGQALASSDLDGLMGVGDGIKKILLEL